MKCTIFNASSYISIESTVNDANGLNCNKDTVTLSCSVENGRPAVSTNRTLSLRGIQSGSSCVAGCVWKGKKFLPTQTTEETYTDLSAQCSISKRKFTCPSGGGSMIDGNVSTSFRGVTIDGKCVEGCLIAGKATPVGKTARITEEPIFLDGIGLNKSCSVTDIEYRCNSNLNQGVYKNHNFSGFGDTKRNCRKFKGCIYRGKEYDSGNEISRSFEGCGGGANYQRNTGYRCENGTVTNFSYVVGTCPGGPSEP